MLRRNTYELNGSETTMNLISTDSLTKSQVKYRSGSSRVLVFLVVLFALTTVALAVVVAVTVLKVKDKETPVPVATQPPAPVESSTIIAEPEVCLTEGCVMAAARVRGAMDTKVNPCDDFFNFACGTWIQKHVIPEDKSSFGTFTQLRDDVDIIVKGVLDVADKHDDPEVVTKARKYYKACVDEKKIEDLGLTYIQSYMTALGGFPVLASKPGGNWVSAGFDWVNLLVRTRNGTNSLPLIDVGVTQDDKNPSKYILYVDQPDLGMPSRDYYLKERNSTDLMAYQTMLEEIAVALGADQRKASEAAKQVVDLEIDLANITVRKEDRRDPEKLYNKMTITDLASQFPGVAWQRLITGIFNHVGMTIGGNEPVIAIAPPFLSKFGKMLSRYTAETLANYVVWQRVVGKTAFLPQKFKEIRLKYSKVIYGTASVPARWQTCASTVTDAMPEVVGRLFVETAFKEDAKRDVLDLVDKLREAFKEMIDHLDWMSYITKQIAKEKANYIDPRIGYQDLVYKNNDLNNLYENVTVDENDPLKTLVSIGEASVIRKLLQLRKDYDKSEWHMSPATVNAYYAPNLNSITFPAAILQPPFYSKDQPAYLNYGGIGYVIGHEITHGFDDQGRKYDKEGNLKSWWTTDDGTKFVERAQCIIDQYNGFVVPGTGNMTINGINTLGENIADNGGIKESFNAYRKWVNNARGGKEEPKLPGLPYTPNQLYFLNAAQVWCGSMRDQAKVERIRTDPHSISEYRVYGPMQNYDEFSKAWNCPAGSFMNSRRKCSVW
ncbi:membrane metallo-endopeptidase-like 1 isoform X2 [Dreissena polymorpha]|uniref:membrane metallo-endopeptidase-like 1 isoform X2 n=1 Tax=Dreissena polymorpha TaxID=45954 RepID=UPI00226412C5|nr:membrane metallo-endopeptidase-like 1 isoform X2 [Dreissena polymorpha]